MENTYKKINTLMDNYKLGDITAGDFVHSICPKDLELLQFPSIDYSKNPSCISKGSPLVSGVAQGRLCFDLSHQQNLPRDTIFITKKISNSDLCFFPKIMGVIAQNEDPSTHAVIVSRSMSIPVLSYIEGLGWIDSKTIRIGNKNFTEKDLITLDCYNGKLLCDQATIITPNYSVFLNKLWSMLDDLSLIKVHGNADTPNETETALSFGARGIEPRTEHMFFDKGDLNLFRCLIYSNGHPQENIILEELEKDLIESLVNIYKLCEKKKVVIRLFDPPLHEFIPHTDLDRKGIQSKLDISDQNIADITEQINEINPMMGLRGIRLLLKRPNIASMQIRAILKASYISEEECPWISIPMIIDPNEITLLRAILEEQKNILEKELGKSLRYKLGAMIETPRAVLKTGEIAKKVDFISFGTNDLTAQTFCFSRGDVFKKFLSYYLDKKILEFDPFLKLDETVQQLIKETVVSARRSNPSIHIGLCGEQGSHEETVHFCASLGINTISCNPHKINHVRLFAAQYNNQKERKMHMKSFIDNLNHSMLADYSAVNENKNPVALSLHQIHTSHLAHIMEQYCLFSRNISAFLLKAFYEISFAGWNSFAEELIQNIKEELNIDGEEQDLSRLPHFVLLRKGFAGVGHDIGHVKPSYATNLFIKSIIDVMEDTNPAIVAGGCYALESSAVPELKMTYKFSEMLFNKLGTTIPAEVKIFFTSHIGEIEVGHEARMKEVCEEHIKSQEQIQDFTKGFSAVLEIMDDWWNGLLAETLPQKAAA